MNDPDSANAPLDDTDDLVLAQIEALYATVDPVPAEAYDRVLFALSLESMATEVARLCDEELVGTLARSAEQARTMTFESNSLTITVSVLHAAGGTVRLDGWLAPGGSVRVELRTSDLRLQTMSDENGRFVFDDVAVGQMQLAVHPTPGSDVELTQSVLTPPIVL